ncbi:hypothetical protein L227DRAFT_86350 [Lentinus tigrinus ALCF2SS1-6]|uniref:Uncharacterized protein n=1 Tax=Lentinus tigrinus ALCF2SS1-6 TaxID=1328759 RepID=A0A5C2SAX3_9APHY|nr:hypothetical protein L227DRAFT_86350 [Lentinus tigrinus ALCF2SS1-6]
MWARCRSMYLTFGCNPEHPGADRRDRLCSVHHPMGPPGGAHASFRPDWGIRARLPTYGVAVLSLQKPPPPSLRCMRISSYLNHSNSVHPMFTVYHPTSSSRRRPCSTADHPRGFCLSYAVPMHMLATWSCSTLRTMFLGGRHRGKPLVLFSSHSRPCLKLKAKI